MARTPNEDEAAAIAAAIERFVADTAPASGGEGEVRRPLDPPHLPLVLGAYINQLRAFLDHLLRLLTGDLANLSHQSTSVPSIRKATRT